MTNSCQALTHRKIYAPDAMMPSAPSLELYHIRLTFSSAAAPRNAIPAICIAHMIAVSPQRKRNVFRTTWSAGVSAIRMVIWPSAVGLDTSAGLATQAAWRYRRDLVVIKQQGRHVRIAQSGYLGAASLGGLHKDAPRSARGIWYAVHRPYLVHAEPDHPQEDLRHNCSPSARAMDIKRHTSWMGRFVMADA